jgi:hypothetical protein
MDASTGEEMNTSEFLQGANDCLVGVEHKAGKGQSYDAGYASQYQHEQNLNALRETYEARIEKCLAALSDIYINLKEGKA